MSFNDTDGNEIRLRLLNEWGGWLQNVYDAPQLQQMQAQIPLSWMRVCNMPCAAVIDELWSDARRALPRFVEYLHQSTLALLVADGLLGPTLVYYIKNWEETQIAQYESGFMLAGLPTPVERIYAFEQSMGKIPASLERLWRVHGFVLLKSGGILSSLNDSSENFCGFPTILGLRELPCNPQEQYECLAIADVWKELPICLTRKPTTSSWDDFIVLADRDGTEVAPAASTQIDDLLTDWTFSKWIL